MFLSTWSLCGKIFKLGAVCMPPHTPLGFSHPCLLITLLCQNLITWSSCLNGWGFSVTSDKKAETAGSLLHARLAAHGWIKLMHYSERKICGLWVNFGGVGSYSRGERPIVLPHRAQRASDIPYSRANGAHPDSVVNWPADMWALKSCSSQKAFTIIPPKPAHTHFLTQCIWVNLVITYLI